MKHIYKYQIPESAYGPSLYQRLSFFTLGLPEKSEYLSFGAQGRSLVIWFRVDSRKECTQPRKFVLAYTGRPLAPFENANYRGTVQVDGLVYHLLEVL